MKNKNRLYNFEVKWADLDPDNIKDSPCINCETFKYKTLLSIRINSIEFIIVKCCRCGLMWRNPMPDKKFITDLYSKYYFNVKEHSPELIYHVGVAAAKPDDQNYRQEKAKGEVMRWMNEIGIKPIDNNGMQQKLLEIGGGCGYLQKAAADKGWDTIGIEISSHGIKEANNKGLKILPIPIDELYIKYKEYYNVVVFFDFLEHVVNPASTLKIINKVLVENGKIILRIPVVTGCPRLHLIDHIWHFTEETIEELLIKEGFRIIQKYNSGVFKDYKGNKIDNITIFAKKVN